MKVRNKNLTTLTIVALLLVVLTLIAVSGTYAKYTTTVTGKSTAIVAKWNFKAKNNSVTLSDEFVIDLGQTATVGAVDISGTKKIQPGSKGEIVITIDNTDSDVAASLTVTANAISDSPLEPEQFTFSDPVIKNSNQDVITSVPAGETATATVTWEWKYNANKDNADNAIGSNAAAQAGTAIDLIGLTVTGYQANPQGT